MPLVPVLVLEDRVVHRRRDALADQVNGAGFPGLGLLAGHADVVGVLELVLVLEADQVAELVGDRVRRAAVADVPAAGVWRAPSPAVTWTRWPLPPWVGWKSIAFFSVGSARLTAL